MDLNIIALNNQCDSQNDQYNPHNNTKSECFTKYHHPDKYSRYRFQCAQYGGGCGANVSNSTESGSIPFWYKGSANSEFVPYVAAAIAPSTYPFAFPFIVTF